MERLPLHAPPPPPPPHWTFSDQWLLAQADTYTHNHQTSGHLLNHGAGLVLGGPSLPGCSGPWTPLLSSSRMGATVFVQPLDLVKNRMQLSGEGAKTREYKTSFHALTSILRAEGLRGIYTGYGGVLVGEGSLAAPGPGLTP